MDDKVLEAAREEFLEVGYPKASLRRICAQAGVTTGTIYSRFGGKDELFEAVIDLFLKEIDKMQEARSEEMVAQVKRGQFGSVWHNTEKDLRTFMVLFANHADEVKMLGNCEGSKYENYIFEMCEREVEANYDVMAFLRKRGLIRSLPEKETLSMLLHAYYMAFLEPIQKGYTEAELAAYGKVLAKLYNWRIVFNS